MYLCCAWWEDVIEAECPVLPQYQLVMRDEAHTLLTGAELLLLQKRPNLRGMGVGIRYIHIQGLRMKCDGCVVRGTSARFSPE